LLRRCWCGRHLIGNSGPERVGVCVFDGSGRLCLAVGRQRVEQCPVIGIKRRRSLLIVEHGTEVLSQPQVAVIGR